MGALTVASRTATAFRGEVGLRTDRIFAVDRGGQLNLFGKFAYAHDEISNPQANVSFAAIGGIGGATPFTVFGARPSRDLGLATAGAEWRLTSGVSFLVKFDGEFGELVGDLQRHRAHSLHLVSKASRFVRKRDGKTRSASALRAPVFRYRASRRRQASTKTCAPVTMSASSVFSVQ